MKAEVEFHTAICSDYESLLKECQQALVAWREQRESMIRFGPRSRAAGDHLQKLQATYAKAYNRLEQHSRKCEVCRFTTALAKSDETETPICITSRQRRVA